MDKKSKQSNPVRMIRGEYIYFTEREKWLDKGLFKRAKESREQ